MQSSTGKAAFRFGQRPMPARLDGCGEADGIHHVVGGCRLLEPQRTLRHNRISSRTRWMWAPMGAQAPRSACLRPSAPTCSPRRCRQSW